MQARLICSSHSPLMHLYAQEPQGHAEIRQLLSRMALAVTEFNPELVVVLGCDHFNGFFLNCMPSFCVGTAAEAVADVGGTAGSLNVTPLALSWAGQLRQLDIDTAVSMNMTIDHGFSQTMAFVLGPLDRYPTLPIFVNSIAPPYVPFKRSRLLGAALAQVLQNSELQRVLVLATGGMSHNPTPYYPDPAEAEAHVAHYQLNGDSDAGMTQAQWLERLDVMHREGAWKLADGRRTREDIRMNPELDKRFAEILCQGDLQRLDDWDNVELIKQGGIGFTELHTWVVATSLFQQLEPAVRPVFELYAETLEYGIGYGALSGGFR